MTYVHPRTVSPQTLLGEVCLPMPTFQCSGCEVSNRPDDRQLGVPEVCDFTDDMHCLYASVAAERCHRVAEDRCRGSQVWPSAHRETRAASTAPPITSSGGSHGKQPSSMPWPS